VTAMEEDARRYAPSVARNKDAIAGVLARYLPSSGLVLEIASGSGEHAVHFASSFPALVFQPTDPSEEALASIAAWRQETALPNMRAPLALDVTAAPWPINHADAVTCINMIHIAPWEATLGLMAGAARIIPPGGLLFLYGPYKRAGQHTAPSNAEFDASLRERDARWGVRDLETVAAEATAMGFAAPLVEAMPANNLSLIFRRLG
jgi:SAM-dependent methyltransferase